MLATEMFLNATCRSKCWHWGFEFLRNEITPEKLNAAKSHEVTQTPTDKWTTSPTGSPNDPSATQSKNSILNPSKPAQVRPFMEESEEESGDTADTQELVDAAKGFAHRCGT